MLLPLISLLCSFTMVFSQDPVANIVQGRVVGIKVFMENSLEPIAIYFGIPYAAPPIGKLRFAPPERHNGWKRTYFAHRMAPRCPQVQTESSDSMAARGNLSLLDQYMALLWIRENISAFGGDPTSVTLLGHSAGADSVLHHLVSPRTTGLFHRVIIMSPRNILWQGIYGNRSVTADEIAKVSRDIARAMGCSNRTSREEDILQCMKNKPLEDIVQLFSNITLEKYMQPVPDDFLPESMQYLPRTLDAAMNRPSGSIVPVDIMLGTTDLDSLKLHDGRFKNFLRKSYKQIQDFAVDKVIPDLLQALLLNIPATYQTLQEAVRWEYWSREKQGANLENVIALEALGSMDSAVKWAVGSYYLAEKLAAFASRVYAYRYSLPSTMDLYGNRLNFTGAVNGAELIALFGEAIVLQVARRPPTNDERQISTLFRHYIINFIKFGSPTSQEKWPRFTINEKSIFEICDKQMFHDCGSKNVKKDIAFWLQYLPQLANSTLRNGEYSDKVVGYEDENRLRGGVYAMCGISIMLLLMLFASGLLLHRRRFYRPASINSQIAY